jgi:ABC-type multidrug transport system fused ATPase/permease subunit
VHQRSFLFSGTVLDNIRFAELFSRWLAGAA